MKHEAENWRSIGGLAEKLVEEKTFTGSKGYGKNEAAAEGVSSTRDGLTEQRSEQESAMTADRPTIAESRPKSTGNRGGAA